MKLREMALQPRWLKAKKIAHCAKLILPRLPVTIARLAVAGRSGRVVQVENTNYCNFKCEYCVTHAPGSLIKSPRGHMTMATFEAILSQHPEAMVLILQGDGEPLLDPTLFDKIALARERGLFTQVISNGSMVKGDMVDRLLSSGPDLLLFSIDAVSPDRNMAQRAGLRFDEVESGIRKLTSRRRDMTNPMIVGLLSIVHGQVDEEVRQALLSFNAMNIDILLYKQLNPAFEGRIEGYRAPTAGSLPNSLRNLLNYSVSHQRIASIKPCPQLHWDMPYYLWNGERTACCVLNDSTYASEEFQRPALLKRYHQSCLPKECESCSFFAGYAT